MKKFLPLFICSALVCCLSLISNAQNGDDCTTPWSIPDIGNVVSCAGGTGTAGPFDLTGFTPNTGGNTDPGVPAGGCWSDPATTMENSAFITITVPDVNAGADVFITLTATFGCATNPLGGTTGDWGDTQFALYTGNDPCNPGAEVLCNDDKNGFAPWFSEIFGLVPPGDYILIVDTWDDQANVGLGGQFCVDWLVSCSAPPCGNGITEIGEDICTCPQDAPCIQGDAFFAWIDWTDFADDPANPSAYCPSELSAGQPGYNGGPNDQGLLYIPFVMQSLEEACQDANGNNGLLTTNIGTLYTSTSPPSVNFTGEIGSFIQFIAINQAELAAGGIITINYTGFQGCSASATIDIDALAQAGGDIATICPFCNNDGFCDPTSENYCDCGDCTDCSNVIIPGFVVFDANGGGSFDDTGDATSVECFPDIYGGAAIEAKICVSVGVQNPGGCLGQTTGTPPVADGPQVGVTTTAGSFPTDINDVPQSTIFSGFVEWWCFTAAEIAAGSATMVLTDASNPGACSVPFTVNFNDPAFGGAFSGVANCFPNACAETSGSVLSDISVCGEQPFNLNLQNCIDASQGGQPGFSYQDGFILVYDLDVNNAQLGQGDFYAAVLDPANTEFAFFGESSNCAGTAGTVPGFQGLQGFGGCAIITVEIYIVPATITGGVFLDTDCPFEGPIRLTSYPELVIAVGDVFDDANCTAGAYLLTPTTDASGNPTFGLCNSVELPNMADGNCTDGASLNYDFFADIVGVPAGEGCVTGDPISGIVTCVCDPIVCGNGICEVGEDNVNCPGDCPIVCGNGICEVGEDNTNCPGDCPSGVCGEFEGGPWTDISATSCVAGETVEAGFSSWANEAYILNVVGGVQYTFSMCDGYDPNTPGWNGGVVLSAYEDADGDGAVDDVNNPIATGTNCSLTFTAIQDGVILLVVNDANCTGILVQNDNGLVSITTDTDCVVTTCGNGICEVGEDNANCPGDCPLAICGDGVCDAGEDFITCPGDCPCEPNNVFVDLSGPSISTTALAYCASDSDLIPDGSIGIPVTTFGGVGDLTDFPYDLTTDIGTTSGQVLTDGTSVSINYILLTQADLDAGGTVTITFQSTVNSCSGTLSFDIADLIITDIAASCGATVCGNGVCDAGEDFATCPSDCLCGNGVCDAGEDFATCPGDCPAVCGEFDAGLGPWIDIRNTSCVAGETIEAGFSSWANEAYILDVIEGTQYTFSMCDGYDPNTPGWNGGVVLSAYEDTDADGVVDDVNNPIATGTNCSLTFTALQDGIILLVVNDANCTGVGVQNDNGLVSITTDTNCGGNDCQLDIPMPYAGWHMISSYCNPLEDSITQVFSPIVNDVIQVKNLTGQIYVPSFNNFNTFTTWDITQGYLVKVANPTTLPINGGLPVDLNIDQIPLYTGWNMIAYWLQGDADPIDVFANITMDVIQVKDLNGAYVPSFNDFNNMGNMSETRGYQVKMAQDNVLQYNAANILPRPAPGAYTDDNEQLQPIHFTQNIKPNPNTSTILIMDDDMNPLNYGDELGVFTEDGLLVGSFVYKNAMMGGLVFGDDETEEGVDGILTNEAYVFKIWDSVLDEEHEVEMDFIQGNSTYKMNDLCVVSFKNSSTTGINEIVGLSINASPNPVTTQLVFDLEIEQAGVYNIGIYSVDGKMIDVVANRNFATGNTQLIYNVEHLNAGLYMYRVVSRNQIYTDRFTVVR